MKQKGFTIIELLAAIVILIIILAIAIPTITLVVEDSKQKAFKSDAQMVIRTVNLKKLENETFDPTTYNDDLAELLTILKLDPSNYSDIDFMLHENKFYIKIVGQNRWSGLSACGPYDKMIVVSGTCEIDIAPPVLTLNGLETVEVSYNGTYTEEGVVITDDSGETLEAVITGTVDTSTTGTYVLTYTATDSSGNTTSITRTINVTEPPLAQTITPFLTSKNGNYYYTGANPNNWVEFGQVSSSDTTPIMWRIIRKDAEGLKIIYEGTKNGVSAPTANGKIGNSAWNTTYVYKWESATSAKTPLNTWYTNFYAVNKDTYVNPINWCIGAAATNMGDTSLATYLSLECTAVTEYGPAKTTVATAVGLINPSWFISTSTDAGCVSEGDAACANNNFLYKSSYYYWTMTKDYPSSDNYYAWVIWSNGSVLSLSASTNTAALRPVINLNLNVIKESGTGTLADPYVLK
ncbi:MAG: DUF5011 domain-containing protein [Bacilli bacterium]|nr:DUF5011 domain-containing protein [Bacilli bacterium]